MLGDKSFLDTNIIIYAYDISAGEEHVIAREIMNDLWDSGLGVISTQVLQEFFVNITSKIPKPLAVNSATGIIKDLLQWEIVVNDSKNILDAIEIKTRYNYSFWDSLILESAISAGVSLLLSENFSHTQTIKGVKIKNPFM